MAEKHSLSRRLQNCVPHERGENYETAGARIERDAKKIYDTSDIILKVRSPQGSDSSVNEVALLREGQTLISFIQPGQNETLMDELSARNVSVLAMDSIPRISRAQIRRAARNLAISSKKSL